MEEKAVGDLPKYSPLRTATWFFAGAAVTAVFSGSLAALTASAGLVEVLAVGMVVPSFTWVVQLSAAGVWLPANQRRLYWGELGRVCLVGSVALLPSAVINMSVSQTPRWLSVSNVLASVVLMGTVLYYRSTRHGIAQAWPLSWCVTITVNMMLFLGISWRWWS